MTLQEYFIDHAQLEKEWAFDRNPEMPEQLQSHARAKAWWRCEKGHEWQASIESRVYGGWGCPYCAGKLAIPGENDLATVRPELLAQWDYEKNKDIFPNEILPSAHDKVWWRCELGHSYAAVVYSRTRENDSGCPYCTGKRVLAGFNDLATLKPKLAEQWYEPLNGKLQPEDVTLGSNKKVWWQCREGHVWQAAIYSRTRRRASGCPVCAGTVRTPRTTQERTTRRKQISLAASADAPRVL